jgi:hypothetical protein
MIFGIPPASAEEALPLRTNTVVRHDMAAQTQASQDLFAVNVTRRVMALNGGDSAKEIPLDDGKRKKANTLIGRYLQRHLIEGDGFLVLRKHIRSGNRPDSWARIHAGYGQLFADESSITHGRNGAVWEEPGCLYVRTSFSF